MPEKKPIAVMAEEERQRAKAEMARAVQPEVVTCDCADFKTDPSIREKEVSSSIAFEDALHNQVYIRKGSGTRKKRDSNENLPDIPPEKNHNFFSPVSNISCYYLFTCIIIHYCFTYGIEIFIVPYQGVG